jgi:hypothetical protein
MKYWVNAVCINQGNIEERNVEVKRMQDIYGKAWAVVVWLGEEADGSNDVADLIAGIDGMLDPGAAVRHGLRGLKFDSSSAFNYELGDIDWKPLYLFFNRLYWQRVWIIQELAMNHNSTIFLCGPRALSRRQVRTAAEFGLQNIEMLAPALLKQLGAVETDWSPDIWSLFSRLATLLTLDAGMDDAGRVDLVLDLAGRAS